MLDTHTAIQNVQQSIDHLDSVMDIDAAYDGLSTLYDVASGLSWQGRFWDSSRQEATPAGLVIENILDYLSLGIDALAAAMRQRQPKSGFEKDVRAGMILTHAIKGGEDASEIAALASALAASKH